MSDKAEFLIRTAGKEDISLILGFIKELAEYENMLNLVTATEQTLTEWMFEKHIAEAMIGEINGEPVGFALYFYNFSTFVGRAGIYLEDLYVKPTARRNGLGKAFFKMLAQKCIEQGCGRLEWACLDWNKPSIDFYLSLGAKPMSEWTVYRIDGSRLNELAE